LVAEDDAVRDVWAFVEGLDLGALYAAIAAREGEPGRPTIDPKILMALWLYAASAAPGRWSVWVRAKSGFSGGAAGSASTTTRCRISGWLMAICSIGC
jgi:hypothetical protein